MPNCAEESVTVYSDPALVKRPRDYGAFVGEVLYRGVISMGPVAPATVGLFLVAKGDGHQRLIFHTRRANRLLAPPAKAVLPTSGGWGRCNSDEDAPSRPVYLRQCDAQAVFYRIALDEGMEDFFTLPEVDTKFVTGLAPEVGAALGPRCSPRTASLPTGWSWALYFCQSAVQQALIAAGGRPDEELLGRGPPQLLGGSGVKFAVYRDNFAVMSADPASASALVEDAKRHMERRGLGCHPMSSPEKTADVTGMRANGEEAPSLLRRGASGSFAARLITRFEPAGSWASKYAACSATRHGPACCGGRRLRSIFQASYALAIAAARGAMDESLLPLLVHDFHAGLSGKVRASDASLDGYGVCSSNWSSSDVATVGRLDECWRFRAEEVSPPGPMPFVPMSCSWTSPRFGIRLPAEKRRSSFTPEQLDSVGAECFDMLSRRGHTANDGAKFLACLQHFTPGIKTQTPGESSVDGSGPAVFDRGLHSRT